MVYPFTFRVIYPWKYLAPDCFCNVEIALPCRSNATFRHYRLDYSQQIPVLYYTNSLDFIEFPCLCRLENSHLTVSVHTMELINEALNSVLYFSMNPLPWAVAIVFAVRNRKLRIPVIAAVSTQTLFSGILVALNFLSDTAFPVKDMLVMVVIPGVLSGILISAMVILVIKRRRLMRFLSSRRIARLAYK